jgi:hypothetical protein
METPEKLGQAFLPVNTLQINPKATDKTPF